MLCIGIFPPTRSTYQPPVPPIMKLSTSHITLHHSSKLRLSHFLLCWSVLPICQKKKRSVLPKVKFSPLFSQSCASMASSITQISLYLLLLTLFSKTQLGQSLRDLKSNPNRPSTSTLPQSITDVHDLLPKYGLPKGLLPNNVRSYTLSEDGTFEIHLENPCYVHFDQLVYYNKNIKGKLSFGSVSDVSGIQAKKLFIWVSVTGIHAEQGSDSVEFYVGALSEKLPAKQFEDIPVCKNKACQGASVESIWGNFGFLILERKVMPILFLWERLDFVFLSFFLLSRFRKIS